MLFRYMIEMTCLCDYSINYINRMNLQLWKKTSNMITKVLEENFAAEEHDFELEGTFD